ncbi:hypothetical protein D6C81_09898 [Aureobasidium pullulans]|nr:hypothetical protein D6C81_09898 [Aureobasidium pullulans]
MFASLLTVASLALAATASWIGNINFNSPSLQHREYWASTQLNFTHGVASGDPYPNSVILWTRLAPSFASDRSNVTVFGTVEFYCHETGDDANLTCKVDRGTAYTTSDIDSTIKAVAKKLRPFTTYYQFTQCGTANHSPIGRTKTSPSADQKIDKIRLIVYSCSRFPNGYFHAYGIAARKDRVDHKIHLGDYIYETSAGVRGRDARATNPSRAILTLYDYRTTIAQYGTDADSLLSHQRFAWIAAWDDHEAAYNRYRDEFSAMNNTEESFVRSSGLNMDDNLLMWRDFHMGTLLDLTMLDTHNYNRSITDLSWSTEYIYNILNDAGRSLMGSQQENWFHKTLISSKKRGIASSVGQSIKSAMKKTVHMNQT